MVSVSTIRSLSGVKPGSGRISIAEDLSESEVSVKCVVPVWFVVSVCSEASEGFVALGPVALEPMPESECNADEDVAVAVVAEPVRRKAGGR